MKIWRLAADVNQYANFTSNPKLTHEQMLSFDGRSKIEHWTPPVLQRIEGDSSPVGDVVGFDMGCNLPAVCVRWYTCRTFYEKHGIEKRSVCV